MKLKDAIPAYQTTRQTLVDQKAMLTKKKEKADSLFQTTGDSQWSDASDSYQKLLDETSKAYDQNQEVLSGLVQQYMNVMEEVTSRQQADTAEDIGEEYGRIMLTISRMCAGKRVPASDERKVMDFDKDVYAMAKNMQIMMEMQKKRTEECKSAWEDDDEDQTAYDPEGTADNTEASGDLPSIEIPDAGAAETDDGDGGTETF